MKLSLIISVIAGLLLAVGGGLLSAEEPNAPENSYEQYTVIAERNIFSKDRRPPREERSPEQARKIQVLSIYVLRGIAGPPGDRIAFIEEQISGQTQRASIGTDLLDGQITDIKYDRVAYAKNEQTRYIRVGGEFGKTETTVVAEASEEQSQEQVAPQAAPADSNAAEGDESDILKRLMERRKNEMGQ